MPVDWPATLEGLFFLCYTCFNKSLYNVTLFDRKEEGLCLIKS